ncbi:hypothetical protein FIBSPDRAFT_1037344 [Athelia psychrophila]|uniref:Uncharacterized protein n=1 Tax=Athelia psychrophila TaxID=1759441 RepID=A0A166UKU6_9AGAM|nr:hypothetical protein FIBSPDRAFT_1037344 [Fibularhizoctonia sp. CBS 109695]
MILCTQFRPLPDERPRASVANLIGRFEKRQSTGNIVLPPGFLRPTSVTSHTTGDSAKEEIKEKREWPPVQTSTYYENLKPGSVSPPAIITPPAADEASLPAEEPTPELEPEPTTAEVLSPPTIVEPEKSLKPATATSKPTAAKKSTNGTPVKSPRTAPSTASKTGTPIRSPRSPPSAHVPLRPQHTGTSTRSATNNAGVSTPARAPRPASTAPPSNRSKTPSASRPKIPAATGVSRPKTPSSGLFAPTAASLARSRAAGIPLPTPVKKATLSSSSAERLAKPTAASASRARAPATPASTPARKAAAQASPRAGAAVTKTAVTPRAGPTPARASATKAAKSGPAAAPQLHDEPQEIQNAQEDEHVGGADTSLASEEVHHDEGASLDGSAVHSAHEELTEQDLSGTEEVAAAPESSTHSESEAESHFEEPAAPVTKSDIVDIVNLLETNPPSSGIAEDAPEIPDEE